MQIICLQNLQQMTLKLIFVFLEKIRLDISCECQADDLHEMLGLIICLADDSHELSSLIVSENNNINFRKTSTSTFFRACGSVRVPSLLLAFSEKTTTKKHKC